MPAERRFGMDHEHYDWSPLSTRGILRWPENARVALCVIVNLEHMEWIPPEDSYTSPLAGGLGARSFPYYARFSHREYGHRVGIFRVLDALEAQAGYSDNLLHGEGVAIGMAMAFDLSVRMGLCPAEDAARVRRHFAAVGLATGLEAVQGTAWNPRELLAHMGRDKKVRDGKMTFILAHGIGRAFLCREVATRDILAILEDFVPS